MRKEEFSVETFRPDNVSALSLFLGVEYPDSEISKEEFLKWEYLDGPFGKALITLARDEKKSIVSQYAMTPLQILLDGKVFNGSLSLNTLTAKGFRGKGLFVKTAEANYGFCHENDIFFTIGIPNSNSFPGFTKRLGFKHTGNLIFYVKPLRRLKILKSILQRDREKKGGEIAVELDESSLSDKSVSFFNCKNDIDLYNLFWHGWSKKNLILLNRSAEYLKWRYFDNPLRKYNLLKLVEQGEMKALVVFRTLNVFGMRACVIMDFYSNDDFSGKKLLESLFDEMKSNGLDIMITISASRNESYSGLKKAGFIQVPKFLLPQQLPFIIRTHKPFEGAELLFDLRNWHFTFGDYDIF